MTSERKGAAVLGSPVAHSLSPVLHRAAYDALGLSDWSYRAVECTEGRLGEVLRELEAEGLAGVSLTMPLKRAVLPMLARSDRLVADVGAANTLLFGGVDGDWWGANTDVPGMVAALRVVKVETAESAVVLGGGATAASAFAALRHLGVGSTRLCVRRPEAAEPLQQLAAVLGIVVEVVPFSAAVEAMAGADLVISTTPAGATDALAEVMPDTVGGVLFDVVYSPWPTTLAATWEARGGQVIGGLELLVEQAALQVMLMTGKAAPIDVMRAAGRAAL